MTTHAEDWITDEVVKDAACWPRMRLGEPRGVEREAFDRWLARVKVEAVEEYKARRVIINIDPAPPRVVPMLRPCPRCGLR